MKCQVQRKLFLAFLLVLVNSSCVAFVSLLKQNILQFPKGLKSLQSSSYVGASFGTDSLVRPDDEDSQEFKEYLKKLLEMQSMRARTGFSAPSSGSSDAYFAKLNRIKLERAARRELGLPEDVPDFDYKPEDYQSAGTDMEKNADTDLKNSEVFGPKAASNLARPLTAAEVRLAQAAEERAKRALQGLEQIPVRSTTPSSSKVESKKAPQIPTYEKPAPPPKLSYLEQRSAALTRLNPTPSSPIPPIAAATTTTTTQKPQAPTHANKKPTVTPKSISEEQTSAAAKVEIPSSTKLEPTKPAQVKNLVLKRKLEVHELDVVGRALEMTVKHRGGGPFGPGRLPESEIPKLEEILNQAYQILVEDSKKAVAVEVESGAKTTEPLPKLNIQSKQQVQQKPSQATLSSQRSKSQIQIEQQAQKLATPVMEPIETVKATPGNNKREDEVVRRVSRATPSSNSQQVVPITVGIDRFLTRPEDMHVQELESVRDGLIQILAMLQDHIKRRPRDAPIFDDHSSANNPTLHQAPTPVIPVVDPTDRFISTYFKSDDEESKKFDQELQLALGLLLKHRGGPGFGHGRLKGKELNLLEQTLRSVAQKLQQESQ